MKRFFRRIEHYFLAPPFFIICPIAPCIELSGCIYMFHPSISFILVLIALVVPYLILNVYKIPKSFKFTDYIFWVPYLVEDYAIFWIFGTDFFISHYYIYLLIKSYVYSRTMVYFSSVCSQYFSYKMISTLIWSIYGGTIRELIVYAIYWILRGKYPFPIETFAATFVGYITHVILCHFFPFESYTINFTTLAYFITYLVLFSRQKSLIF